MRQQQQILIKSDQVQILSNSSSCKKEKYQ